MNVFRTSIRAVEMARDVRFFLVNVVWGHMAGALRVLQGEETFRTFNA